MVLITFKLLRYHGQGNFKSLFGAYGFSKLKSVTIMAGSMQQAGHTHGAGAVCESIHLDQQARDRES